jgi:hypothetical protein
MIPADQRLLPQKQKINEAHHEKITTKHNVVATR